MILRIMSLRISRLASKICVKNILRIFQAHFRENVENTEPGRKFHHSYKKKACSMGLKTLKSFKILDIGWNPSDHSPVTTEFTLPAYNKSTVIVASADLSTTAGVRPLKKPSKVKSDQVNWNSYSTIMQNEISDMITNTPTNLNKNDFNSLVSQLSEKMYTTAVNCQQPGIISAVNNPTMEVEPAVIDDVNGLYQAYLHGEISYEEWFACRNSVNDTLISNYTEEEMEKWKLVANNSDARALWKKIDWKGEISRFDCADEPSAAELADHFQSKSSNVDSGDIPIVPDRYVHELDKPISTDEIKKASSRLKDKSTFDGWTPNMINVIFDVLAPLLVFIFNYILKTGVYPAHWMLSLIHA